MQLFHSELNIVQLIDFDLDQLRLSHLEVKEDKKSYCTPPAKRSHPNKNTGRGAVVVSEGYRFYS